MPYNLPSTVTHQNAVALEADGLRDLAVLETVDCAALVDFDSSVLAILIAWQKNLRSAGRALVITNPPLKLRVLAQVYGVSELLGVASV